MGANSVEHAVWMLEDVAVWKTKYGQADGAEEGITCDIMLRRWEMM